MSPVEPGPALRRMLDALAREGLLAGPMPEGVRGTGLSADSRTLEPGSVFLAIPGAAGDGHQWVAAAVDRGAALVVVERLVEVAAPTLLVRDARRAARVAARAWFDSPADRMLLVGITGTNGKTTSAALTAHLLNASGVAGTIGTLGAFDGAGRPVTSVAGSLTTPGPVDLQATFAALRDRGVDRVAMEASSHSLDQGRLDGLVFAGAVFTNLTRDHLDYHGGMEAYLAAKLRLAELVAPGGPLAVNQDDPAWVPLHGRPNLIGFGLAPGADLRAEGVVLEATGSRFRLAGRFGGREAELPLPGDFNISNALGAAAAALGLGLTLDEVTDRLRTAPQVPGRMERLATDPCPVLRDYAHTPDALRRVLATLRPLTPGRLILVFGCGGDRDRGKRPMMGRIASELADLSFVTSDNPRTEDPDQILDDILAGMGNGATVRVVDRREAIGQALDTAADGDTILLAGKGHESHQIIGTVRHPFDERAIVQELLDG